MQKLAVFGGTFNPPHWGHIRIAEAALKQYTLDRVIWVPNHHPPHRLNETLTATEDRLAMVQRAIATHPAFTLSTAELDRPGPSYALETLLSLQHQHPNSSWYWLAGLDAFQTFPRWYGRHQFASLCTWLVAPRNPNSPDSVPETSRSRCEQVAQQLTQQQIEVRWHLLELPPIPLSSSLIREQGGDRHSIQNLVPDAVQDYILQHRLYSPQK